jgi:hypothetical protein
MSRKSRYTKEQDEFLLGWSDLTWSKSNISAIESAHKERFNSRKSGKALLGRASRLNGLYVPVKYVKKEHRKYGYSEEQNIFLIQWPDLTHAHKNQTLIENEYLNEFGSESFRKGKTLIRRARILSISEKYSYYKKYSKGIKKIYNSKVKYTSEQIRWLKNYPLPEKWSDKEISNLAMEFYKVFRISNVGEALLWKLKQVIGKWVSTDPKNRKREFNSDSGRHKYTKEQLDYLFGHRHCLRKGPEISKITQDFNIKFSTNVSEMAIRMKIRRMLHSRKRK